MGKGISRAIHRQGKMLYRFYCRTGYLKKSKPLVVKPRKQRVDLSPEGCHFGEPAVSRCSKRVLFDHIVSERENFRASLAVKENGATWHR